MAKLIKVLVLLAVLVGGVIVYVQYAKKSAGKNGAAPAIAAQGQGGKPAAGEKKKEGGMQVQEKYGFAPVGQ